MSDTPVDDDALLSLVDGDRDFLEKLVATFLDDCTDYMEAIRTAIEEENAEALVQEAHGLKGAAANMQAEAVQEAARQLEDCGRSGDFGRASDVFPRLETETDRLRRALRTLVGEKI